MDKWLKIFRQINDKLRILLLMQAQANYKPKGRADTSTPATRCSLFMTRAKRQGHPNPV